MTEEQTILDRIKGLEDKLEAKTGIDLPTPVYIFMCVIVVVEIAKLIL